MAEEGREAEASAAPRRAGPPPPSPSPSPSPAGHHRWMRAAGNNTNYETYRSSNIGTLTWSEHCCYTCVYVNY